MIINKKLIIVASILLVVVLAHGSHSHSDTESEHPYFKQLKNYMKKNVTNKYGQVALSIFIISFPSIPVFFSLSFLGRVLKKKGDKNNFSSTLLTLLLAFACGTLLGDVMLHILPYLFSPQGDSHNHHIESHVHHVDTHIHHHHVGDLNQKPSGCPFAKMFGQAQEHPNIPNDAAHAHLHQHDHAHDHDHDHHDHAHPHVHDSAQQQVPTNSHAHDHDHAHDHAHDHTHDHAHDHTHDHDHHHEPGHKCNHKHDHLPGSPKEQVHAQIDILEKQSEQLLHGHDHDHDHGHGHAHSLDQMVVPLMIIGGIVLFIILDYIFMKIHKSSSKKDKKSKSVKVEEKGDKSKKEKKDDQKEEECDSDSDEHGHGHSHHHHHGDEEEEHSAVPFLIGDFLHNFTDGLAIGAAYTVSFNMGVTSTFVIMIHELPHEIGDFAHLIKYNYNLTRILKTQFLTSFGALIGGFLGLYTGEIYKRELLSVTAGGFLYMCLANVIPEIQADLKKDHSFKNLISVIISLFVGVGLMCYVAMLE